MEQMGADTCMLDSFLKNVRSGEDIFQSIENSDIPENVKSFLEFTFRISLEAPAHVKAAVFTFGREDLIPSMFNKLLQELCIEYPEKVSTFKYYIERHIEVDGDHHSHLAINMVEELCGEDENKWKEAGEMAGRALEMRYKLWDALLDHII
jgi:pyrroloquinoline quinone (PQQ) biosynthesis protein C